MLSFILKVASALLEAISGSKIVRGDDPVASLTREKATNIKIIKREQDNRTKINSSETKK